MKLDYRNSIVLFVIGAYLVLNWGFMLIRIPPVGGGGVPAGELLLVIWIFFLFKDSRWVLLFCNSPIFIVFLTWWALGIGRALYAIPEYGMWALRDASHVIDSLYLWVGFVFAATLGSIDRLFVWLPRILGFTSLLALTYPWRAQLQAFSPTISGASGYTTTIFFQYVGISNMVLWEAVRRLIQRSGTFLVSCALLTYVIGIFQSRTIYLQFFAIVLMLLCFRGKAFKKMGLVIVVGLLAFILLAEFGPKIQGRLGQNISLDFIVRHFETIVGISSKGVEGPAGGVTQRYGWWQDILDKLFANNKNLVFGLGYGFPLVDFVSMENEVVREPHNSYLSIFARSGLLGLLLFITAHILLLRSWWKSYKLCRWKGYQIGEDRLFLLVFYFIFIWIFAIAEDAFEKPFFTIPYYFFWGVVLHYGLHLKKMLINGEVNSHEKL
jgi:O-Antigen ligase